MNEMVVFLERLSEPIVIINDRGNGLLNTFYSTPITNFVLLTTVGARCFYSEYIFTKVIGFVTPFNINTLTIALDAIHCFIILEVGVSIRRHKIHRDQR